MGNAEMTATMPRLPTVTATLEQDPDMALVRRYLAGDDAAFESLFRKYQTSIFNIVSRMVKGEDAYDLTQDVFCQVLRALHTFRGDSKFSTWLYSIARNVCLNRIRRRNCAREESLDSMMEDQSYTDFLPDESADVERIVETHELQRIVNSVLATLPAEQRLLIVLRDFEQLSYEEISLVTEMSLSNVKSRLHRARMAFKYRMRPYLDQLKEG